MQYSLKNVLRLASGYSLATIAAPLMSLLMTPILTRVLTRADYGMADLLVTATTMIAAVAGLGIGETLGKFQNQKEHWGAHTVFSSGLWAVTISALIFGLGLFLGADFLGPLITGVADSGGLLRLASVGIFCTPIVTMCSLQARLQMSISTVNLIGFTMILGSAVLNLIFIVNYRLGVYGMVLTTAVTSLLVTSVGLYRLRGEIKFPAISRPCAGAMFRMGILFMPGLLGFSILNTVDRLILAHYVTKDDLGLYAIANKLSAMAGTLMALIESAWWPFAMRFSGDADAPVKFAKAFELFAVGGSTLALGLGLFAPEALQILAGPAFQPAAIYVIGLAAYYGPLVMLSNRASMGLYLQGKSGLMSLCMGAAALANVLLNLLWAPRYGIAGAVAATVAAGFVWITALVLVGQRHYLIPYRWGRIAGLGLVFFALVAGLSTSEILEHLHLLHRVGIFLAYGLLLGGLYRGKLLARLRRKD